MQFCWYYILQILAHFFTRLFPRDPSVLVLMVLHVFEIRTTKLKKSIDFNNFSWNQITALDLSIGKVNRFLIFAMIIHLFMNFV